MKSKKICLVLPSLTSGGMERAMTQLAFHLTQDPANRVALIVMTRGDHFYKLPPNLAIMEPEFSHRQYSRIRFTWKILRFVRRSLKNFGPDAVLSFGGKYNAFVLLASIGMGLKIFVSDRSRPGISYGKFFDTINRLLYRCAHGIVAQTEKARDFHYRSIRHHNIAVIGNPIRSIKASEAVRENIILNVGRFIPSKRQLLLIEYFSKLPYGNWRLVFLGDGKYLPQAKQRARELGVEEGVVFAGNQRDIDQFYQRAKIFAFTSVSEGFPNALGEAMSAGLACISFDCVAGPSDLIDDGVNGYLIPLDDDRTYIERLATLMKDEQLRNSFGLRAKQKMKQFEAERISKQFQDFMFA